MNDLIQLLQSHQEPGDQSSCTPWLYFQYQYQLIIQLVEDHQLICAPIQTERDHDKYYSRGGFTLTNIPIHKFCLVQHAYADHERQTFLV